MECTEHSVVQRGGQAAMMDRLSINPASTKYFLEGVITLISTRKRPSELDVSFLDAMNAVRAYCGIPIRLIWLLSFTLR